MTLSPSGAFSFHGHIPPFLSGHNWRRFSFRWKGPVASDMLIMMLNAMKLKQ